MKTIGAAEFKANCLQILDELGPEGIIITKRGKPVAEVKPARRGDGDLIGLMKDLAPWRTPMMTCFLLACGSQTSGET